MHFATCLFGISLSAIDTIPAVILRAIGTDGVMEVAGNAPPIIGTIFIFLQNFITVGAIPPTG